MMFAICLVMLLIIIVVVLVPIFILDFSIAVLSILPRPPPSLVIVDEMLFLHVDICL